MIKSFAVEGHDAAHDLADELVPDTKEAPKPAAIAPRYTDLTTMMAVDWQAEDLDPLRRMMSRIGVELETAVEVFFAAAPERYNMLAKSDLEYEDRARCNLLDSIHRRIACGFYLPDPARGLGRAQGPMQDWILAQESDAQLGRVGRWVFDRALLDLKLAPQTPHLVGAQPVSSAIMAAAGLKERLLRIVRRD